MLKIRKFVEKMKFIANSTGENLYKYSAFPRFFFWGGGGWGGNKSGWEGGRIGRVSL